MADNMILFKRGTAATLPSTRDGNTLYFVTDTGALYLGQNLIADKTGNYAAAIESAIGALDATVKDESGLVKVTIVETDGKLTSVTVNQDALLSKFAEYQPKGNYKTQQTAVADKGLTGAKVLKNLSQNANGDISYETRDLTPADIGAQPAGNYQPAGDYKTVQTAVTDPTVNGKSLTFIDTISQDTNGKISATKKNVNLDDYSTKAVADGLYAAKDYESKVDTLIGSDNSKSARTIAAEEVAKVVANADEDFDTLKEVADWIANDTEGAAAMQTAIAAIKKEIGGTQGADGFTTSRIDANEAKLAGITDTVKKYVDDEIAKVDAAGVNEAIGGLQSGKADKVTGATNGNFAGLDSNGNLTDSGKKAADFATAAQGSTADSALQSVTIGETTLTKTNNTISTITLSAALNLTGGEFSFDGRLNTAQETANEAKQGVTDINTDLSTNYKTWAATQTAIQGSTTNTIKDCVDAINTMNNKTGEVTANVQNIVAQLTWGSF